ncbi:MULTISPECIES: DUF2927 domain-containing protein [unclassified Tenacibaculum]|uniref:DUF2927 domain-containing protein n=1 Tax=unclassified Tenacibaculum TaxID=2635139 RepID=UPI001F3AB469|nr:MULTISPECIES: DUF2927 domain-containing protein [unclassified Tenacibaculum]MCF2875196.1 DUF2927 domain-containing protein [Tenacibaculum sp. Cn5-1]MCF2935272.1 DUF2927 domain-containing protein [Tenacibaculum sp. Cn5-34]MCG7511286.1 DUF2927 domain-containing protein [Tenacibaculum sp. Cn5-46]
MKNKLLLLLFTLIALSSCSVNDDNIVLPESEFSEHEINVIEYFKEVALGFEFGNASKITRKWNSDLNIFIGGEKNKELITELEKIITEINELATDGFKINIVNNSSQSNYYIFFGSGNEYAQLYPSQVNLVDYNWGLFSIFWNSQNQLIKGHMYVDIYRANLVEQKHLLREELTQSLGLARDSKKYPESIFQSEWTSTNKYTLIDNDLIRLLYHPDMSVGLTETQVDVVLKEILRKE